MNCSTPRPASRKPSAMPISSSRVARSDGIGSPLMLRWFIEREVENPNAPARIASAASLRIWAMSSGVAASNRAARSPIT